MSSHTVADEVHAVWRYAPLMLRDVFNQLGDAEAAEPRAPFHLRETWLLNRTAIVHDDYVVVAELKVCSADIRAGRVISAATEAMDHDLRRMGTIEVCVIEGLRIQYVQFLRCILRSTRLQIEFDLRVRASVRLLKA